MLFDWAALDLFVRTGLQEFVITDFALVRYGDTSTAVLFSFVVIAALCVTFARLLLLRRRHSRQHSGHEVARRHQRGFLIGLAYNVPKFVLALALIVILVALSDPFVTSTEEIAGNVDSRVRIDLVDTSLSMAWEFANSCLLYTSPSPRD